jgi:hypothetical protein
MTRRRALLESFVRAKNELADLEAQPLPLTGWRRTSHLREIRNLKTNAEGLYELFSLELMRS